MEKKLNKEQLKAIKHKDGPLLIVAGAGTGKTTVITERIKHLIVKGFVKPEKILALTFTEKAALEMETRVDEVMPLSYGDIWITTFHSFCDQILRQEGLHVGLPTNYKLMTTAESVDLFKRNLFNFSLDYFKPLGNPNKFIEEILKHISRLQDEVIIPSEYLTWVNAKYKVLNAKLSDEEKLEAKKWKELAIVYKEYNNLKLEEAKFDFGDLIIKTIELFKKRPNILKKYQSKFKHVLVDEFQDTNFAQNILVNLVVQKHKNITVVGDDNQSIYRFRGASISNILQFKNQYKKSKTVTLNENYRSTQEILDGAYKLIKNNDPDTLEYQLGISKKLLSANRLRSIDIKLIHTQTSQREAEKVAEEINSLVTVHGSRFTYGDIAILVRANNHADVFIREFERQGIPHQFLGPSKLFERPEIVDLISYLNVLYNPEDTESLYRLLTSEIFEFEPIKLSLLLSKAKKNSISLFEAIAENNDFESVVLLINKHLSDINTKTAGQMLYEFIEEINLYNKIVENDDLSSANSIAEFFKRIKDFENENPTAMLRQTVDYIKLLTEVGESPNVSSGEWQENNSVNILTVHSAKGLEFPIVFLVNLVTERFPGRNRSEALPIPDELIKETLPKGDFHLQEERRLFYVGMTRAKERLYLTAARYYGDGVREKKISPFVMEALGETANSLQTTVDSHKIINYRKAVDRRPKAVDRQKIKVDYLSVSQIETFKTCPLHYKLKYIYKLPTPKSASISFGITIHETLKELYKKENAKKVNSKWLIGEYKKNFIPEGFENKKHKEQFFKKGEDYLLGYLENEFTKKRKTVALEEKFTIKLNGGLKIGGTIDRVDDLGKNQYEIVDYKTGATIPTQKEVDKNMQLSVYALATSSMRKVKPEDIKLSLYYLDTQEKITTRRTKEDLENLKKEMLEVKKEIENSYFKCSDSYFCQKGCEFSMFCK